MVDSGHHLVEKTEFSNLLTQKMVNPYLIQPNLKIPEGIHQIPEGIHDTLKANIFSKEGSIDLLFSAASTTIFLLPIETKTLGER